MRIDDLKDERLYLINMNFSACFDAQDDSTCVSVPIFVNTELPKLLCNWDLSFNIKGITLFLYYLEHLIVVTLQVD